MGGKKCKEHLNGGKLSIAVIDLYRADKAITSDDSLPCYEIVICTLFRYIAHGKSRWPLTVFYAYYALIEPF